MLKIKSTIAGDTPIISISYKYNYCNVLYLISAEGEGITKDGIPYLYTYSVSDYISRNNYLFPLFCFFGEINPYSLLLLFRSLRARAALYRLEGFIKPILT